MTANREVWAWHLNDLVRLDASLPEDELADRDYWWGARTYATDIFNWGAIPPVGSILVGYVEDHDKRIISVGQVEAVSGASTGRLRATIRPLLHIDPIDVANLPRLHQGSLSAASLSPVRIRDGMALLDSMRAMRPELGGWLDSLALEVVPVDSDSGQRLREERDAIRTGLDLAGADISEGPFAVSEPRVSHARQMLNPKLFEDNEDDLIFADLRRFDTSGVLEEVSASTSIYREVGLEIAIANINRKSVEHSLGIDLLYWDCTENTYTLLQYKRLTKATSASSQASEDKWRYTRKSELEDQLSKMSSIGSYPAVNAPDWRIVQNPFWFKFVRTDAFDGRDNKVLKGMYVPSDYLRIGLRSNSFQGPNGGFSISYSSTRYIPRGPFVELVRRRYTGSTTAASVEIAHLIETLAADREVVVVTKKMA